MTGPSAIDLLARRLGKAGAVVTNRATTALMLLLQQRGITGADVLIPVNVCHAVVHGITLSGNRPVFLDVAPDGNGRLEHFAAGTTPDAAAALIVHMYGNPCPDVAAIAAWCVRQGVAAIEDCALAPGTTLGGAEVGSFAPDAIFSFGPGKTLDAGGGGLAACSEPPQGLEDRNAALADRPPDYDARDGRFAELFREVRYGPGFEQTLPAFAPVAREFEDLYLVGPGPAQQDAVDDALSGLPAEAVRRRRVVSEIDEALVLGGGVARLPFAAGAVPWRYNLLVDDAGMRRAVVERLIAGEIRVGAWYPPIAGLFGDAGSYPVAARLADRVLNIDISDPDPGFAGRVASAVNTALGRSE